MTSVATPAWSQQVADELILDSLGVERADQDDGHGGSPPSRAGELSVCETINPTFRIIRSALSGDCRGASRGRVRRPLRAKG